MGLLTLFEKIELPEPLNEDVISLDGNDLVNSLSYLQTNYPAIFNLIDKNEWDDAFELARNNTSNVQTVNIDNKVNLTSEQKDLINDLAEENGLQVNFNRDNKSLTLIADNKDAVNSISDVINYLDGKDYFSGKMKRVEPTLSDNRSVEYNDDTGVDLGNVVLDAYIYSKPLGLNMDHTVADTLTESGIDVFKSLALQLGLNEYDNPFLGFIAATPKDQVKYSAEHLGALNNLYSENIIDNRDLEDPEYESIVQNVGLYNNNNNARDIVELVKNYLQEKDQDRRDKYFDEDRLVKNWKEIKNDLEVNYSGSSDKTFRLSRDAGSDELRSFYNRLSPQQKDELKNIIG